VCVGYFTGIVNAMISRSTRTNTSSGLRPTQFSPCVKPMNAVRWSRTTSITGGRQCRSPRSLNPRVREELEMFARLAQLDLDGANTKPNQRRLDSVHRTGLLANQRLTLAGRTPRIFLGNGRNRRHVAVLRFAAEPAENRPMGRAFVGPFSGARPSSFRQRMDGPRSPQKTNVSSRRRRHADHESAPASPWGPTTCRRA
jgi:hypothetical protein